MGFRTQCEQTFTTKVRYNIINNAKLDNLEKAIKAANECRRKLIEKNRLITYDARSELYGKEGQELIDAVTAEHTLIC